MGIPSRHFRHLLPSLSKPKKVNRFAPYRSGWEREYAGQLDILARRGEIRWWRYEAISIKIGNGANFTPDFMIMDKDGHIEFKEVKGHRREAAIVRIKSAALQYPFWSFYIAKKTEWGWVEDPV